MGTREKPESIAEPGEPTTPDGPPLKQAVNLRMDRRMVHRLKLHALQKGVSISDVVFSLLDENLPEYDVSSR